MMLLPHHIPCDEKEIIGHFRWGMPEDIIPGELQRGLTILPF